MIVNNVPVYLIKYEWDSGIPLDQISDIIHSIVEKIQSIDSNAEWISMPTEISLEKIDLETLRYIYDSVGNYIDVLENKYSKEEEENT